MIELHPITPDNYAEALELAVRPEQEVFVAGILKTLADAYVWGDSRFRLAVAEDVVVGFLLVFPFEREGTRIVNIVRLMIDARHQGQGFGSGLLEAAIDWISSFDPQPGRIRISTRPDNDVALALYKSRGFEEAGMEDGEVALYREIGSST